MTLDMAHSSFSLRLYITLTYLTSYAITSPKFMSIYLPPAKQPKFQVTPSLFPYISHLSVIEALSSTIFHIGTSDLVQRPSSKLQTIILATRPLQPPNLPTTDIRNDRPRPGPRSYKRHRPYPCNYVHLHPSIRILLPWRYQSHGA